MADTTDTLRESLRQLVQEPTTDEIDAALRSVERRARRRSGSALAAAVLVVVAAASGGTLAVLGADDDPDVRIEPADTTAPPTSTPGPRRDAYEVLPEVNEYAQGLPNDLLRSTGIGMGDDGELIVVIDLRADATDLAEDLRERWGTHVRIHLGYRNYPEGTPVEVECPHIETGDPIAGLEARLELDDGGVVESGADLGGRLVLTNTTDQEISLVSGTAADGYVVAPGGSSVLGISTQATAGSAFTHVVPAGGSTEVPVAVGTTACQPDGPAGLAPGEYEVHVRMTSEGDGPGSQDVPGVTARAPLTIE